MIIRNKLKHSYKRIIAKSTIVSLLACLLLSSTTIADTRLVEGGGSATTKTDVSQVIRENTASNSIGNSENVVSVSKKAVLVNVTADEKTKKLYTAKATVNEFLKEVGIYLSAKDEVSVNVKSAIVDQMNIVVTRVDTIKKFHTQSVNYKKIKKNNSNMPVGTSKVTREGAAGEKQIWHEIVMRDGVVTSTDVLSEKVVKNPVDEITEIGTKIPDKIVVSDKTIVRGGKSYKYKYALSVTATAYDPSVGNITATGVAPKVGLIAVDPRVIPLGTKMYIESPDGKSWSYGYAVAADTGGAIKGNKIDLFYNTASECINFGVRKATVYILQ